MEFRIELEPRDHSGSSSAIFARKKKLIRTGEAYVD
jgi:hypothetical protein